MKRSLKQVHADRKIKDKFKEHRGLIEYILWLLRNTTSQPSGGDTNLIITAATKGALPDASTVDVRTIAKVNGVGSDNGMVCVVNPSKTGWDAINFWE